MNLGLLLSEKDTHWSPSSSVIFSLAEQQFLIRSWKRETSESDKFPITKESFTPVKWKWQNHSHMTPFYTELRRWTPFETNENDFVNLLITGIATGQIVIKVTLSKLPATGINIYQYLGEIWKLEATISTRRFFD